MEIDPWNLLAQRKLGVGEDWRWSKLSSIGEGSNRVTVVTGGVPRLLKTGPRRGKPTWRDVVQQTFAVVEAELQAVRVELGEKG